MTKISVCASSHKKEIDGTYIVKAEYEYTTVFGYGCTIYEALEDASDILSSKYGRTIEVVL